MKETPIFEEVFMRLFSQPNAAVKILVGGLLSFIPIVNFFAFGYLFRLSAQVRRSGQLTLPNWADWQGLFVDGVKFAVVWLVYWLLPLLLACLFSCFLSALGLALIGYLLTSVAVALCSLLFTAALYRLQMRSEFRDLLDVLLIWRMCTMEWQRFVLPTLVFMGVLALGFPLYGLAIYAGLLMLIVYSSLCFRSIEQAKMASL